MTTVAARHAAALADRAVRSLRENGFDALYVETAREAATRVLSFAQPGGSVGFGGSMTVAALDLKGALAERGAVLLDHNAPGLSTAERRDVQRRQLTCDLFLSSSNALTLDGELVNVDGAGNEAEAWDRIETRAGPMNALRLGRQTPCTKDGACHDCDGDGRICRVYQVIRRRPTQSDFTVVVVGEPLGF